MVINVIRVITAIRLLPLREHQQRQPSVQHGVSHSAQLERVELLLWVHNQQGAIQGQVHTGVVSSQYFHIIPLFGQGFKDRLKVGMRVVPVPVQRVGRDGKVVSREVTSRSY